MFVSRTANERQKSDINHWILAIERFIINLMSPKRIVARITDIIFPILKYCSEKGSNTLYINIMFGIQGVCLQYHLTSCIQSDPNFWQIDTDWFVALSL